MLYYIRGKNKRLTFDFEGYFTNSSIINDEYFNILNNEEFKKIASTYEKTISYEGYSAHFYLSLTNTDSDSDVILTFTPFICYFAKNSKIFVKND